MDNSPNKHMHSDSKKRRFALLFAAGDAKRYISEKFKSGGVA